jgi:FHA domain
MPSYLIVQRGPELGKRIALKEDVNTIGRSNDNDVELTDPYVSRYHSVIKKDGENFAIVDLGSENPVQIRDTALEPGVPFALQHRDVIRIGQYTFSYVTESGIADRLAEVAPMPQETDLFKPSQPGLAATVSQTPHVAREEDADATQVFTGIKPNKPAAQPSDNQPTVAANWFTQLQAEHSKTGTQPDDVKTRLEEAMPEPATAASAETGEKPYFTSPVTETKDEPLFGGTATASGNKPFFTSPTSVDDSSPTEPETDYKSAESTGSREAQPAFRSKEPDTTVDQTFDRYGWQNNSRTPVDEDAPTMIGSNFDDALKQYRQQNPSAAAPTSAAGNFFEQRTDITSPTGQVGNKPGDLPKPPASGFSFPASESGGNVGGGFTIPESSPTSGNIGGGFSIPESQSDSSVKSPFSEPGGNAGGGFGTPSFGGNNASATGTPSFGSGTSSTPSFSGSTPPPANKPLVSEHAPTTRMTPADEDAPTIMGTSYADALKQYRQPQTPPPASDLPATQIADYSSAGQSAQAPKPPVAGQGQGQFPPPPYGQPQGQSQYGQPGQFSPPVPPSFAPQGQPQGNFQPGQPPQGQPPQYGQPGQFPPQGQPPQYGQPGQFPPNQPPRPGQPPQYGQPGQPQPPYGQPQPPQYGQPGQPPQYGQPGQPPYGQPNQPPRPGQPPYGQPPQYGQPGQFPPQGQPPQYGQPGQFPPPQGQPPYGQPGQFPPNQPPYGQPQPPYGQPNQPPRPGQPPQYGQPTNQPPQYGQPPKPGVADKDKSNVDEDDSPTVNIDIPKR